MLTIGPAQSPTLFPQILFDPGLQVLGPLWPGVSPGGAGRIWWLYSEVEVAAIRFQAVEVGLLISLGGSAISAMTVSSVSASSMIQFDSVEVIKWQRR